MKLTRCEKKHFYDSDKYESCPHCNRAAVNDAGAKASSQTEGKASTLGGGKKQVSQSGVLQPARHGSSLPDDVVKTAAIIDGVGRSNAAVSGTSLQKDVDPATDEREGQGAKDMQPLLASVNAVRETMHYEEARTVAFYDNEAEPVVGWLVCVKGEYFGVSFPLKTGKNTIGRSSRMDIALTKEVSISRDRHAILTYEPRKRQYFIQPGEGNGLTYVNDDLLMMPQEIHDYDALQVGNAIFALRTLCGDKFTWDTYMAGEK